MAISTYTELKSAISDFLNRDDLDTVIPTFIDLAEARMNREVRHWRMEDRVVATLDTQYTALPTNFIEPIRMSLTTGNTSIMELVGQLEMSDRRAKASNTSGKPQYYAILDQSIEVFPTPDGEYSLEMVYYETIPALVNDSDTNWVLTNYPDAYLYGALMHSATYLQEDNRMQVWDALYQTAISAINLDAERAKTNGSGRRIKIRSY